MFVTQVVLCLVDWVANGAVDHKISESNNHHIIGNGNTGFSRIKDDNENTFYIFIDVVLFSFITC